MICPKCNYQQNENAVECPSCGIIFHKYLKSNENNNNVPNENINIKFYTEEDIKKNSLSGYLFYVPEMVDQISLYARIGVLAVIALYGIYLIMGSIESNRAGETFLHLVNLPFHEFGHILFSPFGAVIHSLGGTLGQLLMPLICMGVLIIKTRDAFGGAVCLWWFGENFLDAAPYINDARSLSLPLLGGNFGYSSPYGFHDWEFILTELNLLKYDHFIASFSYITGSMIMVISIIWGIYLLIKQKRNLAETL